MKKLVFTIGVLFAAACGGKSDGETMDPCKDPCKDQKMAAMDCATMASNVSKSMEAGGLPADAVAPMETMFNDECTSQAWSQETIDCMAAASNEEEGEACMTGMSEEQQASLNAQFAALDPGAKGGEEGGGEEME